MTIVYVPRQEGVTEEITNMKRAIEIANTFNPYEQKQYKRFIFCNMSDAEKELVDCYLKKQLSNQSGIPTDEVIKGQPRATYIYLAEIGHIKLRE